MEKSYLIIYQGDIKSDLKKAGIEKFMVLNNNLTVIYVPMSFREENLNEIPSVSWWQISNPMSSLIEITNNINEGVSIPDAAGTDYIYKNPYIKSTGKNVLIAIIDSGINYLHQDFIENNKTKIVSIWNQESDKKNPPNGLIFGSEFTREDINKAIQQKDKTLCEDSIGTGTIAAGIVAGKGTLNPRYKGVAIDSELVVVKLRGYKDTYKKGRVNYQKSDFLAAIRYVLDVANRENKNIIINLTVGLISKSIVESTMLYTFSELYKPGIIVVSGAGNEGNTDVHYQGKVSKKEAIDDIVIQVGDQTNLDITMVVNGPDKIGAMVISPSGEMSYKIMYASEFYVYKGKFNLEDTTYTMRLSYPWLESGNEELIISLYDIKPGIWTLRLIPEFIIQGSYDVYLPNKNLISDETRFSDPSSEATISMYAASENVITIGTYNDKTDSIWIGSSKGPVKLNLIKPDIIAPGVDIISTYNNSYNTATGTGVSSSIVSGVLAIIFEYITSKYEYFQKILTVNPIKTYLMIGATKKDIYIYPNTSQGYGILNLQNTIVEISKNFE